MCGARLELSLKLDQLTVDDRPPLRPHLARDEPPTLDPIDHHALLKHLRHEPDPVLVTLPLASAPIDCLGRPARRVVREGSCVRAEQHEEGLALVAVRLSPAHPPGDVLGRARGEETAPVGESERRERGGVRGGD